MTKYISNKQINPNKVNKLDNFNGIGEAVWNYKANWDALYTDNNSTSLRKKIMAKFTPRIQLIPRRNTKESNKPSQASIEQILLPILAKF